MIEIRAFTASDIQDAALVFAQAHHEARRILPLIPARPDLAETVATRLSEICDHVGFVAIDGNTLVGYMIESSTSDQFMGAPTGFCIELYPCASLSQSRGRIYQKLYKAMSRAWIERGFHSHQVSYFATDAELISTFFRLSFGMTHFQLFRDLSLPEGEVPEVEIRYLESEQAIEGIAAEHDAFYPNPPLCWIPHDYFASSDAQESRTRDRVKDSEEEIIAAYVEKHLVAYFTLRRGRAESEVFVHPGNGQISGAYGRPEYRGRGLGKALLAETVRWAKRNKLERLYVEGESANTAGGNLWWKHFRPAEYSVRRCVDARITPEMFTED